MRDVNPSSGRPRLEKQRSRRDASKALAVALQTRYRRLLEASGENEIVVATADLAQCMYENVEFVIWALKSQGGMNPPPPEQLRKITPLKEAANDDPRFRKPPPVVLDEHDKDCGCTQCRADAVIAFADAECTCPPLEAGIIGRDRHMTSCPKFMP